MRPFLIAIALILVALSANAFEPFSVRDLVFLTRDGCSNTDLMRARLDEALKSLDLPTNYQLVDLDTLASSDRRRGYGTPTVLYKNRDLFGAPAPEKPSAPS